MKQQVRSERAKGRILFYNGVIVTMDPNSRVFRNGSILVDGDVISVIGKSSDLFKTYKGQTGTELYDLKGKFVLPGNPAFNRITFTLVIILFLLN